MIVALIQPEPDGVHEVSAEEGRQLFDKLCQDRFGVSGEAFMYWYRKGAYPPYWKHGDIVSVEICIPFWGER